MTSEQNTLIQLKIMNMIKDGDYMEYITPNKEYKFCINRYDSINNIYGNRYIIETKVYDMMGTCITTFKMNESMCLVLLDCIEEFINDIDGIDFGYNMSIPLGCQQGTFCNYVVEINRIDITNSYDTDHCTYYDNIPVYLLDTKTESIRDIEFTIVESNPSINYIAPILKFMCSYAELCDLVFAYFFVGLIDVEFREQEEQKINSIANGFFVGNPYIQQKY